MVRILRLGRLTKLLKIIRLLRFVKLFKGNSKFFKYAKDFFSLSVGAEKLCFFVGITVIIVHIMTCLWLIAPVINWENTNWMIA